MSEPWEERAPLVASWRGITFETESTSTEVGQRLVVHEYPLRDTPYTEPLGRAADRFALTAYVVGPNYDLDRDKILAAARRGDVGTLNHPELGALEVHLEKAAVTERDTERRRATLQLSFVEAGLSVFPVAAPDAAAVASARGAAAVAAAAGATARAEQTLATQPIWSRSDYARFVEEHSARLAKATRIDLGVATDVRGVIGDLDDFYQLLTLAASVPAAVFADLENAWSAVVRAAENAWSADVRVRAIARAADVVLATSWDTYDQAEGVTGELVGTLDAELERSEDQLVIEYLVDLRASVLAALQETAVSAADETTLGVREPTPAHVLAYRLYADPTRDAEMVVRNGLRDPGFAWGTLTVASA